MHCPYCAVPDSRVIDSRLVSEGSQIRRRRECLSCKERFTTFETVEINLPRVIKTDGRREVYNESKLRNGFMRALEKRPVPTDKIEQAITQIKRKMMANGEREIKSRKIGEWVMDELRGLDPVGYVRFASVYRRFDDLQAFVDEIESLVKVMPRPKNAEQLELLDHTDE